MPSQRAGDAKTSRFPGLPGLLVSKTQNRTKQEGRQHPRNDTCLHTYPFEHTHPRTAKLRVWTPG